MSILLRLIINAVALLVTAWIVPGIHLGSGRPHPTERDWVTLLIVALIFGLVNAVIRPIIILLSLPIEILTLGLFTFVINAFMLLLTSWIAQGMGLGFRDRWIHPGAARRAAHLGRELRPESRARQAPAGCVAPRPRLHP